MSQRLAPHAKDSQAPGCSRSSFSIKILLKADFPALPSAFEQTAGQATDCRPLPVLLVIGLEFTPSAAIGGKGNWCKTNRTGALSRGVCPPIRRRHLWRRASAADFSKLCSASQRELTNLTTANGSE
jgi:hypothetical protein